jgi:hypothetical protein
MLGQVLWLNIFAGTSLLADHVALEMSLLIFIFLSNILAV